MNITVFGAGKMDENCPEYLKAYRIGQILAENNHTVYHGYGGVMKATANGVRSKGGISYGIQCSEIGERFNDYGSIISIENSIFERLHKLICNSKGFIVHPGGIGTLSELSLTLDYYRKFKEKPKIYLIGNYWNSVLNNDFIPKSCKNMIINILDIEQLNFI